MKRKTDETQTAEIKAHIVKMIEFAADKKSREVECGDCCGSGIDDSGLYPVRCDQCDGHGFKRPIKAVRTDYSAEELVAADPHFFDPHAPNGDPQDETDKETGNE